MTAPEFSASIREVPIEADAEISTWFHIGGRADRLARPTNTEELRRCLEIDPELLVLGEGANLLVDDAGVSKLVVSLQSGDFKIAQPDPSGLVRAGAGVALPRFINECVRLGLTGIECLAGIPATVGGAAIMNAGGAFGDFAQRVHTVHAIDRAGREHSFSRERIDFDYRQSRLNHLIITAVDFQLDERNPEECRAELKRCMDYKAKTQPLGAKSAGCVFKNPTVLDPIEGIEIPAGERVSAGRLIDLAGCKGLSIDGATVSDLHANFVTVTPNTPARSVIQLADMVAERVLDRFGIKLEREIVFWERAR